jgi:iron(III) transport system permease protein
MDTSLEEAALASGSGNWESFRRITLPLMRPAVFSVLLITFIRAIESFEAAALIGLPARISVMTTKIYLAIHQFPSDFGLAGAYAVTLLVISAGGIAAYGQMTRKGESYATITGKNYRPRVIDLGMMKYPVFALALFIFVISVIFPLGVVMWSSLIPYYSLPSAELFAKMSFNSYWLLLKNPVVVSAFTNSFILAIISATAVMLMTSVIAWVTIRSRLPGRSLLDHLAFIPIAIPGIVLGVSLLWVYLVIPVPVYGTLWILVIAYVTKFMPYGIRAASASMIQINKELEEASQASGAGWFYTFRRVILPLLMPGFVAGWIFISIVSLRELSTSVLLYSFDNIVLSVLIFDMWEGGEYGPVSAIGMLMVLLLVVMSYVARRLGARIGVVH